MRFDDIRRNWFFVLLRILLILLIYLVANIGSTENLNLPDSLTKGQGFLAQGLFHQAVDRLDLALREANTPEQRALATGALGIAHYQLHHDSEAEALFRKAIAFKTGNRHEQARWNSLLATIMINQRKPDDARRYFNDALKLAENDQELRVGIELQEIVLLSPTERFSKLNNIQSRLMQLKPSEVRSSYLVRLAMQARQVGEAGQKLAYDSLVEAKSSTTSPHLLAEILSELAQLYEDEHRYNEAFQLNQSAQATLKTTEAPDLLLELEWREGRLQRIRRKIPEALAAYQRAIEHIESIRHDIPLEYRDGRSSFRATLEPLYQQMADMLLEQANRQAEAKKMQLLRRARNVVELVKQAELEDFLGGRCAIQPTRSAFLEAVEPKTAIIYPIILPDRLELLVSTGNDIQQFTQVVSAKNLKNAVHQFVGALRSGHPNVKTLSLPLYQWLIGPIEKVLQTDHIQTLVIVPDSFLRLIPFSALYDGNEYLIERYAVSTSPGLSIIEPSPIKPHQVNSLVVGLSEPGNVINHLPNTVINEIQSSAIRGLSSSIHPRSRALPLNNSLDSTLTLKPSFDQHQKFSDTLLREKIKDVLSLPGVVTEINSLKPTLPGTVLLNESFTVEHFRQELLHEPYAIVHIASHLIAGSNAQSSFIMAYDDIINFDQLDTLLRSGKFANQPVEMLTLSACQTAEGDDRAPLGLSGLAIKAKVRSALGTLWPVNDESAPLLMVEFYKALNKSGVSKAQALRQAQRGLLANKKLDHPFFWAPYILLGNWL
jgi:CHAT domain-containing protein